MDKRNLFKEGRHPEIEKAWVFTGVALCLLVVLVIPLSVAVFPEDKNRPEDVVRQFIESSYVNFDPEIIVGLFSPEDIAVLREIYGEYFETCFQHHFDPDPYDEKGYDIQSISIETDIRGSSALVYLSAEGTFLDVEHYWKYNSVRPLQDDPRFSGAPYRLEKVDGQWYFDPVFILGVVNYGAFHDAREDEYTEVLRHAIEDIPETENLDVVFQSWKEELEEEKEKLREDMSDPEWRPAYIDPPVFSNNFRIMSGDISTLKTVMDKLKDNHVYDAWAVPIWTGISDILIQEL